MFFKTWEFIRSNISLFLKQKKNNIMYEFKFHRLILDAMFAAIICIQKSIN